MSTVSITESTSSIPQGAFRRIRSLQETLSPSEKMVSAFVLAHPERVVHMTLAQLATATSVSDATALRFARKLGFAGYNQMRMALVADASSSVAAIFEEIGPGDDIAVITKKVFRFNIQLLEDTLEILDNQALSEAVNTLASSKNVYIFAAGTSAPLAEMLEQRLSRVGLHPRAITDPYVQSMQSALMSKGDVVLSISRSGTPPTVLVAVREARRNGAKAISITCDRGSVLSKAADISLVAVTREIRAEAIASHSTLVTLLDALYVTLALLDKDRTFANERRISDALGSIALAKRSISEDERRRTGEG